MADSVTIDVDQICDLIRTELKLNPETPIDENTKLIGGDHDLDSLDILMLVTALEKQCNVKIPDESIGRDAFENVGTLIEFIRERQA